MPADTPLDAKSLFGRALEIADPARRAALLDSAAPTPEVRAEVAELLALHERAGGFLRRPVAIDPDRTAAYEPLTEGPGTRVGPYKLLQEIGEGGMGTVFMAEQEEPIRRMVAVKIIRAGMDSKGVLARFEAERQALAMMDHPNIARVLDAGTTASGSPYFVMELVKGVPITRFCDENQLSLHERLDLFIPVCQAIQHAHMKGIIHRDVKPSNVLVAMYDDKPVPKVIDFGVAKATSQKLTDKTMFTAFGAVVGTLEYMSPEQAKLNQLDIDTRSDVYALGVLLYELLTGSTPLDRARLKSAALDEVLRLIREEEPPRPSTRLSTAATLPQLAAARRSAPAQLGKVLRGELDWIVMRCLEKDRTRRYDGAATLAKDVQRYLDGDAVEACPPTLGYRLRKAYRRNRAAVLVTVAFALLLTVGIVATTALAIQSGRAERLANENAEGARQAEVRATANEGVARQAEVAAVVERDNLRLTRYASEMNLLQAAYEARDISKVKQVLDAQVPVANEPDLRGPEWHYWNRKFHGHELERRIPCPQSVVKAHTQGVFHGIGLAPNGKTAVVAVGGKANGLTVQVWDLVPHLEMRDQFEVIPDGGVPLFTFASVVRFSPDGRKVLIERRSSDRDYWMWNNYGECKAYLIDLAARTSVAIDEAATGVHDSTLFSDDLHVAIFRRLEPKGKATTLVFRQVGEPKELGRLTVPGHARALMAPDRRHVLVRSTPEHEAFTPNDLPKSKREVVFSCWELGAGKPLWQQETVTLADTEFRLAPDGRSFSRLVSEDGHWRLRTCETKTGRALDAWPVARLGEVEQAGSRGEFEPGWALSPDGRRIAFQSWSGLRVCDLGITGQSGVTDDPSTTPVQYPCESFEPSSRDFAFLPDGRLAAVWSGVDMWWSGRSFVRGRSDVVLEDVVVRVWNVPPYGSNADRATGTVATSPDGRLFALCPQKRVGPPGADGRLTDRLCLLDTDGRCVFRADVRTRPADTFADREYTPVGFSGDGRYVYVAGEWSGRWEYALKTSDPFVAWDWAEARQVARVAPDPGTTFFGNRPWRTRSTGERVVLKSFRNDSTVKVALEWFTPPVSGGKVFEFPSGGSLVDVMIPDGVKIVELEIEPSGTIVGYDNGIGRYADGQTVHVHEWDGTTGRYRGRADRKWPIGREAPRLTGEDWVVRGDRAVRVVREPGRTSGAMKTIAEVWDAARRGPADRPLFRHEFSGVCQLNAVGSRLLLREDLTRRAVLYSTKTGGEVLSLGWPDNKGGFQNDFARWSPDGQQFWYGVDADGKPVGWDFRPLPEPKK